MTPSAYVCSSCGAFVASEPAQWTGPGQTPLCVLCFAADLVTRPCCTSVATDTHAAARRCTQIAGHTGEHHDANALPRWHWPAPHFTVTDIEEANA